jgi:hypothetical protein
MKSAILSVCGSMPAAGTKSTSSDPEVIVQHLSAAPLKCRVGTTLRAEQFI